MLAFIIHLNEMRGLIYCSGHEDRAISTGRCNTVRDHWQEQIIDYKTNKYKNTIQQKGHLRLCPGM